MPGIFKRKQMQPDTLSSVNDLLATTADDWHGNYTVVGANRRWVWDPSSSLPHTGYAIINPTANGAANGRWIIEKLTDTISVDNVAAARLLTAVDLAGVETVIIRGHTTAEDGGGAVWGVTADATAVDNTGTVIVTGGGVRLKNQEFSTNSNGGAVRSEWFGFLPTSTAAANVTAWRAAMVAAKFGRVTMDVPGVRLINNTLSFNAVSSTFEGVGNASALIIRSTTNSFPYMMDFSGFRGTKDIAAAEVSFGETFRFGNFSLEGTATPATGAYSETTQSGTGIQHGIFFGSNASFDAAMGHTMFNVSVRRTSGPCVTFDGNTETHFWNWQYCRFQPPSGVLANNVPWLHFAGANNNNTLYACTFAHDVSGHNAGYQTGNLTLGNVAPIGVVRANGANAVEPGYISFDSCSTEGMYLTSNSSMFNIDGVSCRINNLLPIDNEPIVGSTNTSIIRINSGVFLTFGANEVRGGVYEGVAARDNWGIILNNARGAVVDVVRGFAGNCVKVLAGSNNCNVTLRGTFSGVSGVGILDQANDTTNRLIDMTLPLYNLTAFPDGVAQRQAFVGFRNGGLLNVTASTVVPPIRGLVGWWDVSRGQNVGYTAAANTAGTAVDSLIDLSGSGHTLTGTGAARPVLATMNGRQCIQFDGTDDYMSGAINAITGNQEQGYLACVVQRSSWGGFGRFCWTDSGGANRMGFGGFSSGGLESYVQFSGSSHTFNDAQAMASTTAATLLEVFSDGAVVEFHVNGRLAQRFNRTTWALVASHERLTLGSSPIQTGFTACTIGEVVLSNVAPSKGERASLARAMAAKWGCVVPGDTLTASTPFAGTTIAAGASTPAATITVTGAVVGDPCTVTLGISLAGCYIVSSVDAANTVSYRIVNPTGASVPLAASTARAQVTAQ